MELRGKKVLVTGADGFIGSHLVEALLREGCDVRALVLYNSFNSWGWLEALTPEQLRAVDIMPGDVRDPHGMRRAVQGMDVVFHLAALIAIPFSYHSPDAFVETNVKGTLNVLQAVREYDVARVITTSTSEVYGTAQYVPIDEQHPHQGQSPYSASKIGADRMAESFHRSFGTPVVIARPFNTYGPRQSARAVIPTIITQILSGAREIKLGALRPTRDLNYVTDTCRGMIALASCDAAVGKEVNIGSGTEVAVGDLAKHIFELMGTQTHIVRDAVRMRPEASEVDRLVCANGRMQSLTGWVPRVTLRDGLMQTIAWFRVPEHLRMYKAHVYNV
ncbi:MAG: NAD-dependent 4,6-dehydratase LegB [bacterium]|nr:NAD-dependent 4,6-dehydratase LegB [bacterium]